MSRRILSGFWRVIIDAVLTCVLTIALLNFTASVATPFQQAAQNVGEAIRILAKVQHRKLKADAAGNVVYLNISEDDDVTDDTLAALSHLPHLKEVYLIYCPVTGDGLVHVVGLRQLQTLDLYATLIDDRALKHISKVASLKHLNICSMGQSGLDRGNGSVSDDGLSLIAKLPNLESLCIAGTITDRGLRCLVGLKKLRRIEISSPNVTEDGIEWLQKEMPELDIEAL